MVNYLLTAYAADDIIVKMDAEILLFTHTSNIMPTDYAEVHWNKAQRCDRICDEYVLKGIFFEGRHGSIRHGKRSY